MKELTDNDLMADLQTGHGDALAVLFDRYHRLVLSIALKIVRDRAEAEDVMQNVFLESFRAVAQFDPAKGTTKTWLLQYAYHRPFNRRQHLAARHFYQETNIEQLETSMSESDSLLGRLSRPELKHLIRQGLASFNNQQRRVLELASYDGMSMNEIADKTGELVSNIRHYYYRGLKKLKSFVMGGVRAAGHMSDHERYEELAALFAGGFLSEQEDRELREHAKVCPECLKAEAEFSGLFRSRLPLTSAIREFLQRARTQSYDGIRDRFLQRARREGVIFSADVYRTGPRRTKRVWTIAAATVALAMVLLVTLYGSGINNRFNVQERAQSNDQTQQLQQQNSALNATVAQLNESLAAEQREIRSLRAQLGSASRTASTLRQQSEQAKSEAELSSSQNVPLSAELQNRQQLGDARNDIERINQLRANDEATLAAQRVQIAELSDRLRIASATLDLERQLNAAGKDIRELLTARQLHVVDVRDTDANGKPRKAFGRILVTEGRSLTFYAFDLEEEQPIDAKHRFKVWGTQQAKAGPAHSLGFLNIDDHAHKRWTLKLNDLQLVKDLDAVFVTVELARGTTEPSEHKLLYTFLGL